MLEPNEQILSELAALRNDIQHITDVLMTSSHSEDNPISPHCEEIVKEPPKYYDFRAVRSYASCRAWDIMDTEHVSWGDAIRKAWDEVKAKAQVI